MSPWQTPSGPPLPPPVHPGVCFSSWYLVCGVGLSTKIENSIQKSVSTDPTIESSCCISSLENYNFYNYIKTLEPDIDNYILESNILSHYRSLFIKDGVFNKALYSNYNKVYITNNAVH